MIVLPKILSIIQYETTKNERCLKIAKAKASFIHHNNKNNNNTQQKKKTTTTTTLENVVASVHDGFFLFLDDDRHDDPISFTAIKS